MDKNLVRRMEDIEALPNEEKDIVYYFIDMALAYNKTKKASLIKQQKRLAHSRTRHYILKA
jgi:hypothetical protein